MAGDKQCYAKGMGQAFSVILPVIAVVLVGYGAARRGILSDTQTATLNQFVFAIAAPALLFRNVALTEFPPQIPWGLWASYYGAMLGLMALAYLFAGLVLPGWSRSARVIFAFGGAFSNTVMLGIPIILTAFGPAAGLPLFLVLAFHGLLIFATVLTCLEYTTKEDVSPATLLPQLLRTMRDQTVVLGLMAGVIWNFSGLVLPGPVDRFFALLGSAAIPVALVAVGGRLAFISWRAAAVPALLISAIKLTLMPAMVYGLAHYVFGLEPLFTATITVLAAMPSGVFTAVFAGQYATAEDTASSAIVLSTLLGALTIAFWLTFFADLLVV